jgi:hypothetical protein
LNSSILLLAFAVSAHLPAATREIGFLTDRQPGEVLPPESYTARELARDRYGAVILRPAEKGSFLDEHGEDVSLGRFAAIWCHRGEVGILLSPLAEAATASALREYVEGGGGLLLSGAAVELTANLGAGKPQTQPLQFGQDRGQAGLVPARPDHPAFGSLKLEREVLWMSNAVFPAFAQFAPAADAGSARILAKTPGGHENPLVEYPLGRGKIVSLAWRLSPHYGTAPPRLRANFERLTGNLLNYLCGKTGAAKRQEPKSGEETRIPAEEMRALSLAICARHGATSTRAARSSAGGSRSSAGHRGERRQSPSFAACAPRHYSPIPGSTSTESSW